jgi:hypothetical protein
MKRFVFAVLLVVVLSAPCLAAVTSTILGGPEIQGRLGWKPQEKRTEIGAFALWELGEDYLGGGVYGTYDIIKPASFKVLDLEVPAVIYIGSMIGPLDEDVRPAEGENEADAVARLMTGVLLGGEKMQLGLELQYGLDEDLWKPLGTTGEGFSVFASIRWEF